MSSGTDDLQQEIEAAERERFRLGALCTRTYDRYRALAAQWDEANQRVLELQARSKIAIPPQPALNR